MKKIFTNIVVFLVMLTPAYSQPPAGKGGEAPPPASDYKVEGLELPPDQTVANDEGFVTLQAKTKGIVKWLVVSGSKVKYISIPDNSIIISVPPSGGVITVFAVAVVDGKITDFAKTNITIATVPIVGTGPAPGGALHVTFFIDINNTTAEMAAILNSQNLRTAITSKGNFFRYYDIKSPIVTQKKLDTAIQKAGGSFVVIVQRDDGVILLAQAMPKTEQEVFTLLRKVGGL